MPLAFSRDIFVLIATSLAGGLLARMIKLPSLVGYLLAGVLVRISFKGSFFGIENVSQLGLIFLLFSIGLEVPFSKLSKIIKTAAFGANTQIVLVTIISYLLLRAFSFENIPALILALGFSLSSTALVVKLLSDKGEIVSLHGELMVGWLLIQDLAVIPMMIALNYFKTGYNSGVIFSLIKVAAAIVLIIYLTRTILPRIMHFIAAYQVRELMVLSTTFFALGIALCAYYLGLPATIGAFIAGLALADTEEHFSVFAEVRPLRDLFVGIFFVSLGFLVLPATIFSNLGLILLLTTLLIILKMVLNATTCLLLGYHGRTVILVALGLSQIGEFSFIIFSAARGLGLLGDIDLTIGISASVLSLLIFPLLFNRAHKIWLSFKKMIAPYPSLSKHWLRYDQVNLENKNMLKSHLVVCGYGRVGAWVGRALESLKVPFVVVDHDQSVTRTLKEKGLPVIYGDPSEKEILEAASVNTARVIIVAIPDRQIQEAIIAQVKNLNPNIKIISRVHTDEDWDRLKLLKVEKIVQPEFEAAISIIRTLLVYMGKDKQEIKTKLKAIRQSHSLTA